MNEYAQLKENIHRRTQELHEAIGELRQHELVSKDASGRWTEHLDSVETTLQDQLVRVAVVGSVKSGKSTLINSLLGTDLLRRGAGIITAFITRVLSDSNSSGWVELKPWSRVNDEVKAAISLLPVFSEDNHEKNGFDLKKENDRERLTQWLAETRKESQQTRGQLDPNFILLNAYLEGYQQLQDILGERVNRLLFDHTSLQQHQKFVGQESQAVYIQDMELHYRVPWLGESVEIADCQGSDSPNPLHLAMVQEYLLRSHFILYVISSRTGLREADFKLLDFIKTLRMFPQTFLVLNLDLDSHPDPDDIRASAERARKELSWVISEPHLFTFSALYHLVAQNHDGTSERESHRLKLWEGDPAITELTETQFNAFKQELAHRITSQRSRILLGSGLSRLSMVAGSLLDNSRAEKTFMSQNLGDLKKSAKHLKGRQKALQATLATLDNAISGLRDTIRNELDAAVLSYFDIQSGPIVQETLSLVDSYPVDSKILQNLHDPRYLVRQLHQYYLEFRQSLARFLVEKVNLEIVEFSKEQESLLKERLEQSSKAFWSLFQTAMTEYQKELARYNIELHGNEHDTDSDWSWWADMAPPPFSGFVAENALGRGVLLMKFGIGRLTRFLMRFKTRLSKHTEAKKASEREETVEEAIQLVKSETRAELIYAFRDYRQNFKYQYLFKVLERGTEQMILDFRTRAEMTQLDFANLLKHSALEEKRRQEAVAVWSDVARLSRQMLDELEQLRCAVNLDWARLGENLSNPKEMEPSTGVGCR